MGRKQCRWLLLALWPALTPASEPSSTPPAPGSVWNAGTARREPMPAEPLAPLALTVYPGFAERPGGPRDRDPPLAVDVTSVMTRCPNGSLIVTALVIGGQLTPLDNRCPETPATPVPGPPAARPACDANTWNCSTGPAGR